MVQHLCVAKSNGLFAVLATFDTVGHALLPKTVYFFWHPWQHSLLVFPPISLASCHLHGLLFSSYPLSAGIPGVLSSSSFLLILYPCSQWHLLPLVFHYHLFADVFQISPFSSDLALIPHHPYTQLPLGISTWMLLYSSSQTVLSTK